MEILFIWIICFALSGTYSERVKGNMFRGLIFGLLGPFGMALTIVDKTPGDEPFLYDDTDIDFFNAGNKGSFFKENPKREELEKEGVDTSFYKWKETD